MAEKPEFLLYKLEPKSKRLKESNLKREGKKEEYINYTTKGRIATDNWDFSTIKSDGDFQNLKKFFSEYKEQFSENSEIFK